MTYCYASGALWGKMHQDDLRLQTAVSSSDNDCVLLMSLSEFLARHIKYCIPVLMFLRENSLVSLDFNMQF